MGGPAPDAFLDREELDMLGNSINIPLDLQVS